MPNKFGNFKVTDKKEREEKKVLLESGIEVKPVYGPEDLAHIDFDKEIGIPGEYPFTRGIHRLMYRKRPWTMRQYTGFATAGETNKRFKFLIENGQTGLNVAFDLPTQNGLDSDDPMAMSEVGRVGMAIDTLDDMELAFRDIPLDKVTVSLTINPIASVIMAMYFVVAEKNGYALTSLRGTSQNDILKEYIGRGTWIFPVEPSIKLVGDTIEYCANNVPKYSPVSICGYHIRESGANPIQEIAYAFAIACAYIDHVLERGLDIDEFAPRLSFNFDIYGNLFEQICKFRAARRLWANILKDRYHANDPRSMWMRMIAGGGGSGLTIEEPENNIVRGAYYALISALSGAQTMALCCYDEAYTIPTTKAQKISLRTMQILADEMGLTDTVDPLAGSYYVESLTRQMEKKMRALMDKVKQMGGIVKAISEGNIQREISRQAYLYEKGIESGEVVKIGVNKYASETNGSDQEEKQPVKLHAFDPQLAKQQIERLNKIRMERDNIAVEKTLEKLKVAATANENVMPYIMDAVRSYASVGEITKVFKDVFGEFNEPVNL